MGGHGELNEVRDPIDSICICQNPSGRDLVAYGQSRFVGQWWTGAVCVVPQGNLSGESPVKADLRAGVASVDWLRSSGNQGEAVLASGLDDGSVDLWSYSESTPSIRHIHGKLEHDDLVSRVSALPGEDKLASSSYDKSIILWAALSHVDHYMTLKGHTDLVHSVVWIDPAGTLLSASQDRSVRVWDSRDDSTSQCFWLKQPVYSAAKVLNENTIVAGDECGSLTFFDLRNHSLQLAHVPGLHRDIVRAIACPGTGSPNMLASSGDDGRICILPKGLPIAEGRIQVHTPHVEGAYIRGLAYGSQGLYSGAWDGTLSVSSSK